MRGFDDARPVPGLPGLSFIDVQHGVAEPCLRSLQGMHHEYFPHDPQVAEEVEAVWRGDVDSPSTLVHQWLLVMDGRGVGEYVFHVNLDRGILQRHWLAIDRPVRRLLPPRYLARLVDAIVAQAQDDAQRHGVDLIAMMSEVDPSRTRLLAFWRSLGYLTPPIGYAEPRHGRSWSAFGRPDFVPMEANVCLLAAGRGMALSKVVTEAVSAFYLDHYRFTPDEPQVQAVLDRAALL